MKDRSEIITVHFVHPPIPARGFDYCAYYTAHGEDSGLYGWGATQEAALIDLEEKWDEQND